MNTIICLTVEVSLVQKKFTADVEWYFLMHMTTSKLSSQHLKRKLIDRSSLPQLYQLRKAGLPVQTVKLPHVCFNFSVEV